MFQRPERLICKRRTKDEPCGVFMGRFCENPVYRYRRCEAHFAALKHHGLFESLHAMSDEQREKALDMLDDVQKRRPRWEYAGKESELIAAQEQGS
jgi:predicted amidohydrolase YtcJ